MNKMPMRVKYYIRFVFRLIVFTVLFVMYFIKSEVFNIMEEFNFFKQLTIIHIIWAIWMLDIIMQIVPTKNLVSIGSQKQFAQHYIKPKLPINNNLLTKHTKKNNMNALKVFTLWISLTILIGLLKKASVIDNKLLLLIIASFYVCDLICVLFWCPFKEWILKNRCCNTCRIFNWDYFMMFVPGVFCVGFFTLSLAIMSSITLIIWEIYNIKHPERFAEISNNAIKCKNCTEYLCGKRKAI